MMIKLFTDKQLEKRDKDSWLRGYNDGLSDLDFQKKIADEYKRSYEMTLGTLDKTMKELELSDRTVKLKHELLEDACRINMEVKENKDLLAKEIFDLGNEIKDLKRENENLTKSISRYKHRHKVTKEKHDNDVQGLLDIQSRIIKEKEDLQGHLVRLDNFSNEVIRENSNLKVKLYNLSDNLHNSDIYIGIQKLELAKKYEWIAKKTKKARIREKAMKRLLEVN